MSSCKKLYVFLEVGCNTDYRVQRESNWMKSWSIQFILDEEADTFLTWSLRKVEQLHSRPSHLPLKLLDTYRSLNDSLPDSIFPFSLLCGLSCIMFLCSWQEIQFEKGGFVLGFFFHILFFSLKAFSSRSWFLWLTWHRQWCNGK